MKKRAKKTKLGYSIFFCLECRCTFNERTGTPFYYLEYPTDIVLLVVFYRLRYRLSLLDLAEMFLERGFAFTHEAVRDWEAQFTPLITAFSTLRGRSSVEKESANLTLFWGVMLKMVKLADGQRFLGTRYEKEAPQG